MPKEKYKTPIVAEPVIDIPELPSHHYEWILAAAQDHFAEQVEKLELELLRCENNRPGRPLWKTTSRDPVNRAERSEKILARLAEYEKILEFLQASRRVVMDRHLEQSVAGIREFLKERYGSKKQGK